MVKLTKNSAYPPLTPSIPKVSEALDGKFGFSYPVFKIFSYEQILRMKTCHWKRV